MPGQGPGAMNVGLQLWDGRGWAVQQAYAMQAL